MLSRGGVIFLFFFGTHPLLESPGGFWEVPVGVFVCWTVPDRVRHNKNSSKLENATAY